MIVPYHVKVTAKPYVKYVISFEGNASACVKVGDSVVPSTVVLKEASVIVDLLTCVRQESTG